MAHMALTNNLHDLQDTKDRSWGAIHGWIGCQIYLYYYISILELLKEKLKGPSSGKHMIPLRQIC